MTQFYRYRTQQGFTLIELLTVMLILVALASITVETSKDFVFQQRYEVTKDRYNKIKKAIIGDPNQVINGQPNIEGFVKNLARLPTNLDELKEISFCKEDLTLLNKIDCENASKTWITKSYISGDILKDGWGNDWGFCLGFKNAGDCYTNSPAVNTDELVIQSKGKDGNANVADSGYDVDYPKAINLPSIKSDWKISINNFNIPIIPKNFTGTCILNPISDAATCSIVGGSWSSLTCSGETVPLSKLGCDVANGDWNYDTPSDLCLRVTQIGKVYTSETSVIINENGREQIINFSTLFYDVDDDGIKDVSENLVTSIPMGEITIGIYDYDNSVSPNECKKSPNYYNNSIHTKELTVIQIPNTTPPTINW